MYISSHCLPFFYLKSVCSWLKIFPSPLDWTCSLQYFTSKIFTIFFKKYLRPLTHMNVNFRYLDWQLFVYYLLSNLSFLSKLITGCRKRLNIRIIVIFLVYWPTHLLLCYYDIYLITLTKEDIVMLAKTSLPSLFCFSWYS